MNRVSHLLNETSFRDGRTTKFIPIKLLTNAYYNPEERSDLDAKNVKGMAKSFRTVGHAYPILVGPTQGGYTIIEGHQRVTAAILLGWEEVEVFITNIDPATLYAELNGNQTLADGPRADLSDQGLHGIRPVADKVDERHHLQTPHWVNEL